MPSQDTARKISPVRIYVLWHPGLDRPDLLAKPEKERTDGEKYFAGLGRRIARRLYYWFRLENQDGIPVFFRSAGAPPEKEGEPFATAPLPITDDCKVNYIIPLVEANMVEDPDWRAYVKQFAGACATPESGCHNVLLPVALDTHAYQMPACMRELNYLRHNMYREGGLDGTGLISQLTEIICRDLRQRRRAAAGAKKKAGVPDKIKIFLSHAKADGTDEPVAIKRYLQEQTQCEAFFDETDLASGHDFSEGLGSALEMESAGMIVVQGDNYADRPWCRKEVRDFQKPVKSGKSSWFIAPVVVLQTMKGERIGKTIPELGHAPCLRWKAGAEQLVVTTLLREILLGLFYRMLADDAPADSGDRTVQINRTPDPVMLQRIRHEGKLTRIRYVRHPGYGLSRMDRDGMKLAYPDVIFSPFSDQEAPDFEDSNPVSKKLLAVSAGNATDILHGGSGDEHNNELLRRLLRPLFRAQVSVLYGGALPSGDVNLRPWEVEVNFTETLLQLLASERDERADNVSRLFNLSAWPYSIAVTSAVRARWIDTCSFLTVSEKDSGLVPLGPEPKLKKADDDATLQERRKLKKQHEDDLTAYRLKERVNKARVLSIMRRKACGELTCRLPDAAVVGPIKTSAHLFVGGKISGASGMLPGLFEEIFYALKNKKPVYLPGVTRGATGMLANWLANPPDKIPVALDVKEYRKDKEFKALEDGLRALDGRSKDRPFSPEEVLTGLWNFVQQAREKGLSAVMKNKLSDKENQKLLTTDSFAEICNLVWTGIKKIP